MSKRAVNIEAQRMIIEREKIKPFPFSDITFLKPLAYWYEYMTDEQMRNLPPRVINALDSIHMIMKGRL